MEANAKEGRLLLRGLQGMAHNNRKDEPEGKEATVCGTEGEGRKVVPYEAGHHETPYIAHSYTQQIQNQMRTIRTCAGIGDATFLIKKLVNAKEKFNIQLPDGQPQRGHQIWELLPSLTTEVQYLAGMSYKIIEKMSAHRPNNSWQGISDQQFYLSMNQHLEEGKRIEKYLPDLKTTHQIGWNIKGFNDAVKKDFPIGSGQKYIGIYASAYSTVRQWGFWEAKDWFRLIKMIHAERPEWRFVLIGAEWDNDMGKDLLNLFNASDEVIPYINTIGQPLGYVMQVMKRLDYGFYFTSGLPILSETIKGASDLTMFFPPHLDKMMGTFCDPKRKESGQLKECLYCSPDAIYEWWTKTYQAYDRIDQTKGVL
jgi:hypothetical protein